ncbi:MAG: tol-pal system-associated acyl-CoA thioesterase [Bosea sp. (in: a-proteobacteria)]
MTVGKDEVKHGAKGHLPIRVYYEDTDFSGVVYHASYLRFLERGRTELIRSLGIEQSEMFSSEGTQSVPLAFAVRRMTIDWLKPAVMDDMLSIETVPVLARGASMELKQRVMRGDEVLLTAEVTVACVGGGRARRIPEALRQRLKLDRV